MTDSLSQVDCQVDWDCSGTLVCYTRESSSWLPENVNSTCACSTYWMWSGSSCTSLNPTVGFLASFSVLVGGLAVIALMFNIRIIYDIIRLDHTKKWNNSNATLAFTTLSLLSLAIWRALTFFVLVTPANNDLELFNTDEKLHAALPFEKVFISIAVVATTLSCISVSIAWIDIFEKSSKFLPAGQQGAFAGHKWKVYAFGFLFVCGIVAGSSQARTEIAVLAAMPFVLVIIFSYLYAQRKLGLLLQMMGQTAIDSSNAAGASSSDAGLESSTNERGSVTQLSGRGSVTRLLRTRTKSLEKMRVVRKRRNAKNKYMQLLAKIRITSFIVVVSLSFLFVDALLFALPTVLYGWKEVCKPDELCLLFVANDLISLLVLTTIAGVQKFLYDSFQAQFVRLRRMRSESGLSSSDHKMKNSSFSPGMTASPRPAESSAFSSVPPDSHAVRPMSL